MRQAFILSILFYSMTLPLIAEETMTFDMFLYKDKIGYLTVTKKKVNDSSEIYTLTSNSKAKILWMEYDNQSSHEVTYINGKLFKSTHKEVQNGKVKRWTNIKWDGKAYQVDGYKGKWAINEAATHSIATLYFKDVRNVKRLFCDTDGAFVDFKNIGVSMYEFKAPDGTRNVYEYENGKLKRMEFHVSIATVRAERRP
jgi:hypothetical protein